MRCVAARHCIRIARNRYEKSLLHAYVGRKLKARTFRSLWITRINAGSRLYSLPYGRFVSGLAALDVRLNRKMLSELAHREPYSFRSLVEQVKAMTQPPLTDFPSHGRVHSDLVVSVRPPEGQLPLTHRRVQVQATRRFLEEYYAAQLEQRRQQSAQRVSVTEATAQQQRIT